MTYLKACPRCKQGDMYLDEDDCRHCLQCGHIQYSTDASLFAFNLAHFPRLDGTTHGQLVSDRLEKASGFAS